MSALAFALVASIGWLGPLARTEVVSFDAELDALSRGVACDGRPQLDDAHRDLLTTHCEKLQESLAKWKAGWYAAAAPFFRELVPTGISDRVVYPFGGADLLTALAIFPDASEITIMALEPGGDPRSLASVSDAALPRNLKLVRQHFDFLSRLSFSRSVDLDELAKSMLAGVLIYDLAALVALGYEPLVLRYFRLGPTGGRLYYDRQELARIDAEARAIKDAGRRAKHIAGQFGNFEIRYRKRPSADDPHPRERTFRHFSADIEDPGMRQHPELMAHLGLKGRVTAMTKASSYLLWHTSFGKLRNWMLANMDWMVSDSTGFAPDQIDHAVFEQLTWGKFAGPIITHPRTRAKKMIELFAEGPERDVPFAFGYPDFRKNRSLLVTRRR